MGELIPAPVIVVTVTAAPASVAAVAVVIVVVVVLVPPAIGPVIALGAGVHIIAGVAIIVVATPCGTTTTWNETASSTHFFNLQK